MPISFPTNPSSGDTYDYGGIHYIFNNDGWVNKSIYGISAGTNISFSNYNGTGPVVISSTASGSASGVISFNGKTGAVQGVSSFAGLTGRVGSGITTNGILYFDGSDVQGSALLTFNGSDIVLDTSGHFDGNILGRSEVYIKADEAINEGDPVYVTGSVGASERLTVAKADSAISAKMPAAGIAAQSLALNGEGVMIINGWVRNYNTTGLTANQTLFVASGGGLTATRPTSAGVLVQNIARVGRPNSANGSIIVTGASRTNDVPNALRVYQYIEMPDGFTFNTVVSSFNGSTGPVTFNNYVSSFNGNTGAIQGVSSINGSTGSISNVAFTNTAQSFSGLQQFTQGISGSGGVTFYFPSGNTSIRFVSTAARYIEINPGSQNVMQGFGSGGFKFKANAGSLELKAPLAVIIGDSDLTNNGTQLYVDDDTGVISFVFSGGQFTFPNTDGSANYVMKTDGAGALSWSPAAFTNTAQTFSALQSFSSGISASGGITFNNDIRINSKAILGSAALNSATPGCIEFDGNVVYAGTTSGRGVVSTQQISVMTAATKSLLNATGDQNIFDTPQDVITLAANTTYQIEGYILLSTGTTTTRNLSLKFTQGIVANAPTIHFATIGVPTTGGGAVRAQDTAFFNTTSGGVITQTTFITNSYNVFIRGLIKTVDSVTITPQIAFSAAPGGTNTVNFGTYISFIPIGNGSMTSVGPWA